VSTGLLVLTCIGLAALLGLAVQVLILLNRVLRPLREIKQNTDEILEYGLRIAKNLDGADEIVRTRELATALSELVRAKFGGKELEWSA
jgi:HAMP domain-containing protein